MRVIDWLKNSFVVFHTRSWKLEMSVEISVRVMGPHEIIFSDEKFCVMSVLNGLSVCLLDFELEVGTPPNRRIRGVRQAEGRIRRVCLETLRVYTFYIYNMLMYIFFQRKHLLISNVTELYFRFIRMVNEFDLPLPPSPWLWGLQNQLNQIWITDHALHGRDFNFIIFVENTSRWRFHYKCFLGRKLEILYISKKNKHWIASLCLPRMSSKHEHEISCQSFQDKTSGSCGRHFLISKLYQDSSENARSDQVQRRMRVIDWLKHNRIECPNFGKIFIGQAISSAVPP